MGPFLFKFNIESETQLRTYHARAVWEMESCPGFVMNGRAGRRLAFSSAVTSLPMFAKYTRIDFHKLPMSLLLLKLKEPLNEAHIKIVTDSLIKSFDSQGMHGKYEFFSFASEQRESAKVSGSLCNSVSGRILP
jgi:hypothetical protein